MTIASLITSTVSSSMAKNLPQWKVINQESTYLPAPTTDRPMTAKKKYAEKFNTNSFLPFQVCFPLYSWSDEKFFFEKGAETASGLRKQISSGPYLQK